MASAGYSHDSGTRGTHSHSPTIPFWIFRISSLQTKCSTDVDDPPSMANATAGNLSRGCSGCAALRADLTPHPPKDRGGRLLRVGDTVRVIGVPDLMGLGTDGRAETQPVFEHLVGQDKRITEFDEFGEARLDFRIKRGRVRGWHAVWIEPCLLSKRARRRTTR